MYKQPLTPRETALSASLAAISAVVQLYHIGYQVPQFGMWLDLVAVSWIIAYLLFGIRSALITSLIGALIITLFAPSTWIGALAKWLLTAPLWLCLYLWSLGVKKHPASYQHFINFLPPLAFSLVIRCALAIPVDYYFAIPLWMNMSPEQAFQAIPWYIVVIFNAIQTIIDLLLAWVIVFRFKLSRFANWHTT